MIIEKDKNRFMYIFKGLSVIFMYFFISLFKYAPFNLLHINVQDVNENLLNIYNMTIEIIMIFIITSIYEKELYKAAKDLKKNHKEYFDKYFKIYLIGLIIMIASNMIINTLGGGLSDNETAIRNEFQSFPIYTYISSVLLAPILEELIFRLAIKSIIKNDKIYILVSGLLFGSLHLIGMPLNKFFPLYLISYSSCGLAFAYMTSKTNNVLTSTSFHFMHNGIIMSLQVLLLLFT